MEYIVIVTMFFIFLFGIITGSFLNVCILRLPAHEDIISRRSHCMSCGNVLRWYELIPVFSFGIQKGRCRHCGSRISLQYPLVELANGLLYVWIAAVRGFTAETILFCFCASALLVISVIDLRTREIPLGCNLFILCLGAVRLLGDLPHWGKYVTGLFCVSGFFYLLYVLTRGRGIGGGDIKLMAAAGLLLGWQNIILAMVIGCIAGSVLHPCLMKLRKMEHTLAFGPYLAFGILCAMLYGDRLTGWYLELLGIA